MWKLMILAYIVWNQGTITPQASYYADSFEGRRTAKNEIFTQSEPTAASPYLPFGTILCVTNLNNRKSVLVRVNDRGPYTSGSNGRQPHPIRELDLSKIAFMQIADTCEGVIPIKYEIIYQPLK